MTQLLWESRQGYLHLLHPPILRSAGDSAPNNEQLSMTVDSWEKEPPPTKPKFSNLIHHLDCCSLTKMGQCFPMCVTRTSDPQSRSWKTVHHSILSWDVTKHTIIFKALRSPAPEKLNLCFPNLAIKHLPPTPQTAHRTHFEKWNKTYIFLYGSCSGWIYLLLSWHRWCCYPGTILRNLA